MVFEGEHRQPLEILELWKRNLAEFRDACVQWAAGVKPSDAMITSNPVRRSEHWQKPGFGSIKVNTNAAWCKETLCAGVGWVAHDFAGLLQAAGGSGGLFCHSAAAAEATAIRDALELCIKHGFSTVIVESDAKALIQMIRKEITLDLSLECTLGDIETLACGMESMTFEFVSWESNRAAPSVVKYVFQEDKGFL